MKTLTLSLLAIAFSYSAIAQSNLQFSQVLLFTTNSVQTVPEGKAWKVEHFLPRNTFKFDYINSPSCSESNPGRFSGVVINGVTYYPRQMGINNSNANPVSLFGLNGALWLPAGTTIATQCNNDLLSIVEFIVAE